MEKPIICEPHSSETRGLVIDDNVPDAAMRLLRGFDERTGKFDKPPLIRKYRGAMQNVWLAIASANEIVALIQQVRRRRVAEPKKSFCRASDNQTIRTTRKIHGTTRTILYEHRWENSPIHPYA
jgi:hypothetical protein